MAQNRRLYETIKEQFSSVALDVIDVRGWEHHGLSSGAEFEYEDRVK